MPLSSKLKYLAGIVINEVLTVLITISGTPEVSTKISVRKRIYFLIIPGEPRTNTLTFAVYFRKILIQKFGP